MIEPLPTSVKPMEKNRRSRSWEIGVLELQREHCPQNTSMRFVESKNDLFGRIPGLGVAYVFCIAFMPPKFQIPKVWELWAGSGYFKLR